MRMTDKVLERRMQSLESTIAELTRQEYDYSKLAEWGGEGFIPNSVVIRRPNLVKIGKHTNLDHGFYGTTGMELGDYIHISPYTAVIGGEKGMLKMGNFAGTAVGCRIVCGSEDYTGGGLMGATIPEEYRSKINMAPVTYEDFVITGAGVIVLPGVTLGEGSVVGAGAVVTKNTEPWTIYVGTPAKPVKERKREKVIDAAKAMGY